MLKTLLTIPVVGYLVTTLSTRQHYWNIRKITFVAILISIAITVAIIGATILPIASIPAYKLSFTGLPVKITGFIFGPLIGTFVGIVADLLSILFLPSYIHWGYILASGINGFVPGIVSVFLYRFINNLFDRRSRIKYAQNQISELKINETLEVDPGKKQTINKFIRAQQLYLTSLESKPLLNEKTRDTLLSWLYLGLALFVIAWAATFNLLMIFFYFTDSQIQNSIVHNREILAALTSVGFVTISIYLVINKFIMKFSKYSTIAGIVIFSVILEVVQVYLLAYTDHQVLNLEFIPALVQHVIFSPVKIWFNLTIIYFSYKVIFHLLNRNNGISL